ncbi:MAG: EscU/YscU/HrcU family type III secretion system export apparatus switch protein [Bdellovibrionales bacterium]|nr:EscU/YscU/HrcU family type III secretion system export apparatus switch protein [Bdellovibrionales bacterium]
MKKAAVKGEFESAVGLSFREDIDDAPQVVVKGEGREADELVRLARRFGVPVVEDGEVSELLQGVELDDSIPQDLYEAVALILAELKGLKS